MAARLDLACAQAVFESLDDALGVGECVLLQVQNGRTWGFGDPVKASADAWQRLLAQGDGVREGVALHILESGMNARITKPLSLQRLSTELNRWTRPRAVGASAGSRARHARPRDRLCA